MSFIKRPDGTLRKENPQVTINIENDLVKLKAGKARAERLGTLKDHEAWSDIREIVSRRLNQVNVSLEEFNVKQENSGRKLDHRDIDFLLQERKDFVLFLSIVDESDKGIKALEGRIEFYEKELESRKSSSPAV